MQTLRILLADDEPGHADAIKGLILMGVENLPSMTKLKTTDLVIECIEKAAEVDEKVALLDSDAEFPYDIILADVFMPPRDGARATVTGGWAKFNAAILKRLQSQSNFMEHRLLIALTTCAGIQHYSHDD